MRWLFNALLVMTGLPLVEAAPATAGSASHAAAAPALPLMNSRRFIFIVMTCTNSQPTAIYPSYIAVSRR